MPAAAPRSAIPSGTAVHPRRWRCDLLMAVLAVGLAGWVTSGLWSDPHGRAVRVHGSDQAFFEWVLAYGAYALFNGENPYFSTLLNAPDGVNLAVNTSVLAYAALFSPVTLLSGPPVTFALILTLNLAGAGYAWYLLFSRYLVDHPAAAVVGGLVCGFAPGLISHANAHLNWSAGWLAPLVLWRVLTLREPGRWLRNGVLLGVLVAAGFTIAAEGLFFTALACGVFLTVWSLHPATRAEARRAVPTVLAALGGTAAVAGALLAYPLWMHFAGPQSFAGTGYDTVRYSEDVAAFGAYAHRSLAGWAGLHTRLADNLTEENSFFGLPLLLLAVAGLILLWRRAAPGRRATLLALAVTAVVFAVLSWGPVLKFRRVETDITLPYELLGRLPLFDSALPGRLALVVGAVLGVLLALTLDRLLGRPPTPWLRAAWGVCFAAALLPLVPVPLVVAERAPVPDFITAGTWRQYVPPDGVLVPVPLTSDLAPDGQRWQAHAMTTGPAVFALPAGYFLGPGGPDGTGRIGPVPRPTQELLDNVARTGRAPRISTAEQLAAREDLRYWNADVVVLTRQSTGGLEPVPTAALLRATVDLLGPPERVGDVWLWRVGRP